ncbi:MAG: signal peptidase I, partial [Ruminococcus sp.]|nr:signal peptidase I [Ruminococcus sp.]
LKSAENTAEKKGRLSKAFDIALTVLLIVLAGVVAYIMIQSSRGRAVSFFGKSVLVVVTGSMEPSISEGDYIIIERCDADDLKAGDIITFISHESDINGKLVTHRIIAKNADGSFVTKGDANPVSDELPVPASDIEGRYTGRARFFEVISSFGDPKKLIMVFVMIPLLLVSLYEAKTLTKLFIQSKVEQKMSDEELKQKLIREEIEKQKQRLREEAAVKENKEVRSDGSAGDNEA